MRIIMSKWNGMKIKIPESNKFSILRETREERIERLKYSSCMRTKTVGDKRRKSRAQQKVADRKETNIL